MRLKIYCIATKFVCMYTYLTPHTFHTSLTIAE